MKKYHLKQQQLANGDKLFVGVDAAKVSLVLAVLVRRGDGQVEILERRTIGNTREAVASQVKRVPGAQWIYEAGPTGYRLLLWLRELGADAYMVAPSLVPVASGERVKTNTRDAVKLATLAAGGQIKRIRELTEQQYADRSLVRGRRQAVAARSDIARQIKSELLFHGITFGDVLDVAEGEEVSEDVSRKFLKALKALKTGHPTLDHRMALDAKRYEAADEAVHQYDLTVRKLALEARFVKERELLMTIPGVGVITAMEVLVERGGNRFDSGASFGAYTGLTAGEHSTGDKTRRGRITRAGNTRLRTTLVEAAWRLKRKDGWAEGVYEEVRKRHAGTDGGGKKAVVALARQIAVAMHAMLRDGKGWMEHVAKQKAA